MVRAGMERLRELEDVIHEEAERLSPAHAAALAVAADALTADDPARPGTESWLRSTGPVR